MNHIEHLADDIRREGDKTVEWSLLRNLYFRDGSATEAAKACKDWSKANGFHMHVDYSVEVAGGGGIPRCVTFSPIRSGAT